MQKDIAFHYITGVIFIVISIFVLIYFLGFVHTTATTLDGKEYEIFKDLLTMVLTILGLIIAGITFILNDFLSKSIESKINIKLQSARDDIKKTGDEQIKKLNGDLEVSRARVNSDIGYFYWVMYDMDMKTLTARSDSEEFTNLTESTKKDIEHKEDVYYKLLEQAIILTIIALKKCESVETSDETLRYQIKNNLAYYYADKPKRKRGNGDGAYAIQLAEEIKNNIKTHQNLKDDWIETYDYVKKRFS